MLKKIFIGNIISIIVLIISIMFSNDYSIYNHLIIVSLTTIILQCEDIIELLKEK